MQVHRTGAAEHARHLYLWTTADVIDQNQIKMHVVQFWKYTWRTRGIHYIGTAGFAAVAALFIAFLHFLTASCSPLSIDVNLQFTGFSHPAYAIFPEMLMYYNLSLLWGSNGNNYLSCTLNWMQYFNLWEMDRLGQWETEKRCFAGVDKSGNILYTVKVCHVRVIILLECFQNTIWEIFLLCTSCHHKKM